MAELKTNQIYLGDCLQVLKTFPDECIDTVMTSPPYWSVRDYGENVQSVFGGDDKCEHDWIPTERWLHRGTTKSELRADDNGFLNDVKARTFTCSKCQAWKGQLGLESDFNSFVEHLCQIFDEIKRVLKPTGSCWVNLGDTYGGSGGDSGKTGEIRSETGCDTRPISMSTNGNTKSTKGYEKCLLNIPHRFAIRMTDRGWKLRNTIIWYKGSVMPESVRDRFTEDFEYIFFFVKNREYFFEQQFEPLSKAGIERMKYAFGGNKDGVDRKMIGQPEGKVQANPQGRNKRCVWLINPKGTNLPHYASYSEELCETPLKAGCPEQVCNKCGKPRMKIYKHNQLKENGEEGVEYEKTPYSIQKREGWVAVRDLPPIEDFSEYINSCRKEAGMTIEQIETAMESQAPHHWFNGESYPSKEDWITLKEMLKLDETYHENMTKEYYKPAEKMSFDYKEVGLSDCKCGAGFSGGICLDPFMGTGTTGLVALKQNKRYVGIELNPTYKELAEKRLSGWRSQSRLGDFG